MFTFEQIKELIELVGERRLHGVEIERAGFRLQITGEPRVEVVPVPAGPPSAAGEGGRAPHVVAMPAPAAPTPEAAREAPAADLHVLSSPIVGTFYASPSPDSAPYVQIGDRVRKGQVLCIVEAMKLMNEIESDADGIVAEIYPKNAQPVEYGEPLFGIRPD